ncbi:aminopeptidase PepB [Psychromonas sp. B3M02]|uniref:aminopeptidase PepB n=1 Tax=unclassified Psychromonas TaxID=2614957 RepID=UPI000DEA431F|nr:aminopeptidase PepB [Psychromonas sp. B3M02]RBW46429.1 aminopeptidase PepB [Psychromonas sp. B3M02]
MSQPFLVNLSDQKASPVWGEHALLSFDQQQATIHINYVNDVLSQVQSAARKLDGMSLPSIELVGEQWNSDLCWAFSQGFYNAKSGATVTFPELDEESMTTLHNKKRISEWVRETINLGPDALAPTVLSEKAATLLTDICPDKSWITTNEIAGEALLEHGFVGIHNVGKGSIHAPCMLQVDYNPTGDSDAPIEIALVGKGITFDSGGYSLKPSASMAAMKSDMGGAATVTGALALAIANGLQKRVKLYLCCAENMISDKAFKLGDVITYKNGVTVEVLNTDAEGRLVLADGLIAAQEDEAQRIIDAATLTGAAKVAVGRDYNCVLSMDDEFVEAALASAKETNEKLWRLPLESFHLQQIGSSFADIANIHSGGESMAGASTAAAFLAKFVKHPEQNWLHFDLSGSYQLSANGLWAAGGKGHGVQTICDLLLK